MKPTLRLALLTIIFFSLQIPILAQNATPTPALWPPDPKTLFTNHVTIVEQRSTEPKSTKINEPTPSKCGKPIEHYYGDTNWHFYLDTETKIYHFCESATGKITDALPTNIDYWLDNAPNSSPDSQWLTFWSLENTPGGTNTDFVLSSYELATGKIIHLGSITYDSFRDDIRVRTWVDTRHGAVIVGGGPEIFGTSIYTFDVEIEDSLQFAFSGWPAFTENPPSYEYLETKQYLQWKTGSTIDSDVPCTLSIYDKYGYHVHKLAKACLPIYILPDTGEDQYEYTLHVGDVYFFKPFDETDKQFAKRITEINISNGETKDIFYGDADLLSVSPNGQYIVIVINHSYLALFDVENQTILYTSEYFDERSTPYTFRSYVMNWLTNEKLLIYASEADASVKTGIQGDVYQLTSPASLRFVNINGDSTISVQAIYNDSLAEPSGLSPNENFIISGNDIYNFLTGSHLSVFTNSAEMYYTELSWMDDNHIEAIVHSTDDYNRQVIYTLAFNFGS